LILAIAPDSSDISLLARELALENRLVGSARTVTMARHTVAGDRRAGHIVLNMHLATDPRNSTTPLFFTRTTALWLITRAHRRWRERMGGIELGLAALFLGLALQTHVLVIAFIAAVAITILVEMPGLLRTRWAPIGAMETFPARTWPVVAFNLMTERRDDSPRSGHVGGLRRRQEIAISKLGRPDALDCRLIGGCGPTSDRRNLSPPINVADRSVSKCCQARLADIAEASEDRLSRIFTVGLIPSTGKQPL